MTAREDFASCYPKLGAKLDEMEIYDYWLDADSPLFKAVSEIRESIGLRALYTSDMVIRSLEETEQALMKQERLDDRRRRCEAFRDGVAA